VVHFKYDLNINQNTTYNSDLYFHETITLCNELPSFFKQYTKISFTEILKKKLFINQLISPIIHFIYSPHNVCQWDYKFLSGHLNTSVCPSPPPCFKPQVVWLGYYW